MHSRFIRAHRQRGGGTVPVTIDDVSVNLAHVHMIVPGGKDFKDGIPGCWLFRRRDMNEIRTTESYEEILNLVSRASTDGLDNSPVGG